MEVAESSPAENMETYYENSVIRRFRFSGPLLTAERALLWKTCRRSVLFKSNSTVPLLAGNKSFLVSGWACKQWLGPDGRHQIIDFLLPGDLIKPVTVDRTDSVVSVVTLTEARFASATELCRAVQQLPQNYPGLQLGIAASASAEEQRILDQIVRLGTLTGVEALRSLLLQLYERLQAVQLAGEGRFECPITQTVFAEALGTSPIHMNRIFKTLEREGFLRRKGSWNTLNGVDGAEIDALPAPEVSRTPSAAGCL